MILGSFVARGGQAIVPHATNPLEKKAYGIYCTGTEGTITGTMEDGTEATAWPIANGQILPFVFTHVHTDTTATGLIGINAWK